MGCKGKGVAVVAAVTLDRIKCRNSLQEQSFPQKDTKREVVHCAPLPSFWQFCGWVKKQYFFVGFAESWIWNSLAKVEIIQLECLIVSNVMITKTKKVVVSHLPSLFRTCKIIADSRALKTNRVVHCSCRPSISSPLSELSFQSAFLFLPPLFSISVHQIRQSKIPKLFPLNYLHVDISYY